MKLPTVKRILREDLGSTGIPSWVDKLIYPINLFFQQVYYGLNHNLTFQDNIASTIYTTTFTTNATYSTDTATNCTFTPISFPSNLNTKPIGVILVGITLTSGANTPFIGATVASWYESSGTINVNYISGLANSTSYSVTFLVF